MKLLPSEIVGFQRKRKGRLSRPGTNATFGGGRKILGMAGFGTLGCVGMTLLFILRSTLDTIMSLHNYLKKHITFSSLSNQSSCKMQVAERRRAINSACMPASKIGMQNTPGWFELPPSFEPSVTLVHP